MGGEGAGSLPNRSLSSGPNGLGSSGEVLGMGGHGDGYARPSGAARSRGGRPAGELFLLKFSAFLPMFFVAFIV